MTVEELLTSIEYYTSFATVQNVDILHSVNGILERVNTIGHVLYAFALIFMVYVVHHIFDAVWKR